MFNLKILAVLSSDVVKTSLVDFLNFMSYTSATCPSRLFFMDEKKKKRLFNMNILPQKI